MCTWPITQIFTTKVNNLKPYIYQKHKYLVKSHILSFPCLMCLGTGAHTLLTLHAELSSQRYWDTTGDIKNGMSALTLNFLFILFFLQPFYYILAFCVFNLKYWINCLHDVADLCTCLVPSTSGIFFFFLASLMCTRVQNLEHFPYIFTISHLWLQLSGVFSVVLFVSVTYKFNMEQCRAKSRGKNKMLGNSHSNFGRLQILVIFFFCI